MKFKTGDIVYCIDNMVLDIMEEGRIKESNILKLDTPYIVKNPNGGGRDLSLKNKGDYYWIWSRFITEEEYNIKKVVEII